MTIDVHEAEARVAPATAAVGAGIVAGLVGGSASGSFMQARGTLPLVAQPGRWLDRGPGLAVHLAISVFVGVTFSIIGVAFARLFARRATGLAPSILLGVGYGAFWWVLGGLLLMPLWLDMETFTLNEMVWASLAGHLIYGLLLGTAYGLAAEWLACRDADRDGWRRRLGSGHIGTVGGRRWVELDARRHGSGGTTRRRK